MNRQKQSIPFLASLLLCLIAAPPAPAQESVEVPQLLQGDVHIFYLTIDSLEVLTADIQQRSQGILQALKLLQQKLALLPKGSKAYRLERRRYEEKFSQYLADKYRTLSGMQDLRMQTLATVEQILARLNTDEGAEMETLRTQVQESLRTNADHITQAKLEMLQVLESLGRHDLGDEERLQLNMKLQQLQSDRLALYQQNEQRLSALMAAASTENGELPAMQAALRQISETLRGGFGWIETELDYIGLYAEYRKKWLQIDKKLVEVSGLADRFRQVVEKMNKNSRLLRDVEQFDQQLMAGQNGRTILPAIPPMQWPGRPASPATVHLLSPAQIDSMRRALQTQLNRRTDRANR